MQYQIKAEELLHVVDVVRSLSQEEALAVHRDDRWLTKARDPAGVAMAATRVPDDVMEGYQQEDAKELGLKLEPLENFISSKTSNLNIRFDESTRNLYVQEGDYQLEMGTIDPEYVNGKQQEFPDVDYDVKLSGDMEFVYDFVGRAADSVGTDHIVLGARENNFYMFAIKDDKTLVFSQPWEDFEDAEIDKSKFPIDVVLPMKYVNGIYTFNEDDSTMCMNKETFPAKFLYQTDGGIPVTYFIAPRVGGGDSEMGASEVPDSALEEEDKKEL